MRELERCLRESAGLSYVFLAAQKYGFRPFPRLIPEILFTVLLLHVAEADRTVLEEWFKLDENALLGDDAGEEKEWEGPREFYGTAPGMSGRFYVLQSQSKLKDGQGWWPLFDQMQVHPRHSGFIRSRHSRKLRPSAGKGRQDRLGGGTQVCEV